jgi:hypothetical protein
MNPTKPKKQRRGIKGVFVPVAGTPIAKIKTMKRSARVVDNHNVDNHDLVVKFDEEPEPLT